MPNGIHVDTLGTVSLADSGEQIAKRHALLNLPLGEAKGCGHVLDAPAFLDDEAAERLILSHFVGVAAVEILD